MIETIRRVVYQWVKPAIAAQENEELTKILDDIRVLYTDGDKQRHELVHGLGAVGFRLDSFRRQRYLTKEYLYGEPKGRANYWILNPLRFLKGKQNERND